MKKQIEEAFAEGHRSASQQSRLQHLIEQSRIAVEEVSRKRRQKKLEAAKALIAKEEAEDEEAKAKKAQAKPYALIPSIGGDYARIDPKMEATARQYFFTEHIDADGEMFPVSVVMWEGRKVIMPLQNVLLSVPPNVKARQLNTSSRDFTVRNLTTLGACEPEEMPADPREMQQRYRQRCQQFRKRFE